MEIKDYFTIGLSSAALIISIISNFIQKNKETERGIRKNLSDALEGIVKINLETTKLKQNNANYNSQSSVDLRRVYNSQRRILIVHADYLATNYSNLATDIDYNILAGAFSTIGDYQKAEEYWKKTIHFSDSKTIKHMNLRGYARFLFGQGKKELGRNKYIEALQIDMGNTDDNRSIRTDTYIMWSRTEKEFNNLGEANRLIEEAKSSCSTIGQEIMRKNVEEQIKSLTPTIV